MVARGLFSLFLLFGLFSHLIKLIHARTNGLHDGVLDSLSYDPSLISLLQMEQSLDLDDDETSYLATSFLDNGSSFLQHNSKYLAPSYPVNSSSFLEDESSLDDEEFDQESLLDESDEWGDDSSFIDTDEFAEDREPSLVESSSSASSQVADLDADDDFDDSFLQTSGSYTKPSNTFGSLVQLHNFEAADPLNFLQDDTLLLMNEDEQPDVDLEEELPKKSSLKAFVLKSDMEEPEGPEMSQSLDETTETFELKGEVWNVCGHVDEVVDLSNVGRNQSSTICECTNVKVKMPEKMVSVSLISCNNVEVFVNSLISSMELTNCNNVKVRVKTMLPACSIDKCQQVGFWISKENASMIMFSSCKSGDMNVNINRNTSGNPDEDDWVEQPLHEQFEHTINENLKVITKPSSLYP